MTRDNRNPADPFETAADEALEETSGHVTPLEPAPEPGEPEPSLGPKPSLGRSDDAPVSSDAVPASGDRAMQADWQDLDPAERAEAARRSPDYVGDYPHAVPRYDDPGTQRHDDSASPNETGPFDPDRMPERFSKGGEFANEPGWLQPGPKNAQLCYWLNLGVLLFPILPAVSFVIAFLNRRHVGPELRSHYDYAALTAAIGLALGMVVSAAALSAGPSVRLWLGVALVVWYGWRTLRGLARLGSGEAIPNPYTWGV